MTTDFDSEVDENAWMKKIAGVNPNMLIIDSAKGIEKMEMVEHHHHDHEEDHHHNHEEDHDHDGHTKETLDPHIWLSPQLALSHFW